MTRPETDQQREFREAVEWLAPDRRGRLLLAEWCRPLFEPPTSDPALQGYRAGRQALAHEIWSSVVAHSAQSLPLLIAEIASGQRGGRRADGSDDGRRSTASNGERAAAGSAFIPFDPATDL